MKVIEPKELEIRRAQRTKKHKKQHRKHVSTVLIFTIVGIYVFGVMVVPLPLLQVNTSLPSIGRTAPISLPWPEYGQSAIGAVGYGLLDQHGEQKQLPIASVAKVMTAVTVLKFKPINPGEQGDIIDITAEDEKTYRNYLSQGQSVIAVSADSDLTQYQALQAMMLPSANNMSEILTKWAFGSTKEYLVFANNFAKTIGLNDTTVADASGFDPGTKSTSVDLTKLAEIAMNNPIIAEIVAQPEATLPAAGRIYNVNNLLGTNGIVGIKTGNTDEAGGTYMFAIKHSIEPEQQVVIVGVIMGAVNREQAMIDSLKLINEAKKGFTMTKILAKDQKVGEIIQTNGSKSDISVRQSSSVAVWAGQDPKVKIDLKQLGRSIKEDDNIGNIEVSVGNLTHLVPLRSNKTISNHGILWRLRHAGGYLNQ